MQTAYKFEISFRCFGIGA